MPNLPNLFAYLGEDELGSGDIGLKQGYTMNGLIPIVSTQENKVDQDWLLQQMQDQANRYGKPITLVRYEPVEVLATLEPSAKGKAALEEREREQKVRRRHRECVTKECLAGDPDECPYY